MKSPVRALFSTWYETKTQFSEYRGEASIELDLLIEKSVDGSSKLFDSKSVDQFTSAVRETGVSRSNGGPNWGPSLNPSIPYSGVWCSMGVWGPLSTRPSWCRETWVSRTAARLIAEVFPVWHANHSAFDHEKKKYALIYSRARVFFFTKFAWFETLRFSLLFSPIFKIIWYWMLFNVRIMYLLLKLEFVKLNKCCYFLLIVMLLF